MRHVCAVHGERCCSTESLSARRASSDFVAPCTEKALTYPNAVLILSKGKEGDVAFNTCAKNSKANTILSSIRGPKCKLQLISTIGMAHAAFGVYVQEVTAAALSPASIWVLENA